MLIAVSSSIDGIIKLIEKFYYSKNISLVNVSEDEWEIHNLKGRINDVHVIKIKNRYRFEFMKAKVLNPARKKSKKKMSSAAMKRKMAKIRSFKKAAKKKITHRKSVKITVNPKKDSVNYAAMRKAHVSISAIINNLDHYAKTTVTFDKHDKQWLNYILKKI